MTQLLTDKNFSIQFPIICKQLITENEIDNFLNLYVEIEEKSLNIMDVRWNQVDMHPDTFTAQSYNNMSAINLEKTQKIFLKALASDLLNIETCLKLFNSLQDKQDFYRNIRSFKTLFEVDKAGISIWVPLTVNKEKLKENLLPVSVWEHEIKKKDLFSLRNNLKSQEKFNFFMSNKDKWINIKTKNTSAQEFQSQLAYRMTRIQKHKNYVKTLGIKLNIEDNYNTTTGTSFNIKEMLLVQGVVKKVTPSNTFHNLDIIKLVTGKTVKPDQISVKKHFAKLWNEYIPKLDFSFKDDYGNLANHSFKQKEPNFYLPMLGDLNSVNKDGKFEDIYTRSYSPSSFNKWISFLISKKVDFYHKNIDGISAYTQLLNYISKQNEPEYAKLLTNNEILVTEWNRFTSEEKQAIFNQYMDDWDNKISDKRMTMDFTHRSNSYDTRGCVTEILSLFLNENLFKFASQEINFTVITFLNQFANNPHNANLLKSLNFQNLHQILVEEDKPIKTIKL